MRDLDGVWHVAMANVRTPASLASDASSATSVDQIRELMRRANVRSVDEAALRKLSSPESGSDSDGEHGGAGHRRRRANVSPDGTLSPGSTSTSALSLPSFMLEDESLSSTPLPKHRNDTGGASEGLPLGRARSPSRRSRDSAAYVRLVVALHAGCLGAKGLNVFAVPRLNARVRELQEAVDNADHEKRMMEMDMTQLRQQYEKALEQWRVCSVDVLCGLDVGHSSQCCIAQEQFETEIASARAEADAAVKECAETRKQLAATKETYRDVTVSEAHYDVRASLVVLGVLCIYSTHPCLPMPAGAQTNSRGEAFVASVRCRPREGGLGTERAADRGVAAGARERA